MIVRLSVAVAILAAAAPVLAQPTFDERRDWLLARDWTVAAPGGEPSYGGPKNGMPFALVHLFRSEGGDGPARQYTSQVLLDHMLDNHFEPVGVVRAVYTYWDRFSAAQREGIRQGAQLRQNWARSSGTANQRLMFLTNGYLLAQRFEQGSWHASSQSPAVSSVELMATLKDALLAEGRFRYRSGSDEFLSPNYLIHHVIPLLNLYDFAGDDELVALAEALLAYHLTHLALNVHGAYVLEPHARVKGPQMPGNPGSSNATVLLNWLYWGQGDPSDSSVGALQPLVYVALSGFRPWPILERVAGLAGGGAQVSRSTTPNVVDGSNEPEVGVNKRSVFRTPHYAVGAGAFRHVPDGHYLDRSHFAIAWTTDDALNSLQVGHPYWYADGLQWAALDPNDTENERPWWDAPASPFQHVVHERNSAIVLCDIPAGTDPWAGRGRSDWWAYRDEQAADLRKHCLVRFPESVDERVHHDVAGQPNVRWYFLREGETFVGIRSLCPAYSWLLNPERPAVERFRVIQSHGKRCGFVFEVGAGQDYPEAENPFEAFRATVVDNDEIGGAIAFDPQAPILTASYRNLAQDVIAITPVGSHDPADDENVTNTFPQASVNGQPIGFADWPLVSTPGYDPGDPDDVFVSMTGGILDVLQGGEQLSVDWSGVLPVVTLPASGVADD